MLSSLPKVLRGRRDVCTVSHVVLQSAGYVTPPWRVLDGRFHKEYYFLNTWTEEVDGKLVPELESQEWYREW